MYLSKLVLEPTHPHARRDVANPYEMHRTLSRLFADSPDTRPARFLWRLEQGNGSLDGGTIVLLQSGTTGKWERLSDVPGYTRAILPDKQVSLDRLVHANRAYVFRLTCNPTVTRDGKRYGLLREDEQMAWLARQGQQHGFEPLDVRVVRSERVSYRQGRNGQRITLQVVQFDGLLRAEDPARLSQALLNGIGHAKALGLGMLSLAPTASSGCAIV